MHSAGYATVRCMYVCLSVCLSVTFVFGIETVKRKLKFL